MSRKGIFFLFFSSALLLILGYFLGNSMSSGLCSHDEYNCRDFLNKIGNPLYYGMGALAVVFLALLAMPNTFSAWKKFAIWFVPLATLLFVFYQDPGSGDLFSPYAEQVFQWVSGLYVAVSFCIVAYVHVSKKP